MVFQQDTQTKLLLLVMFICSTFASDCPNLAVLKEPINITKSFSELFGFSWTRPKDNQFIANCANLTGNLTPCGGITVYTAVANTTFSQLTIDSVTLIDVGQWRLTQGENKHDVCTLSAAGKPSCDITSDDDTNDLDLGVELSLAIAVTGYYCTRQYGGNISLGDVTEHLFSNTSSTNLMNHTSTLTFNVTEAHFGDVRVIFACEDYDATLTCDGVKRLSRRTTTTSTTTTTTTTTPTTTTTTTPTTTTTTPTTTTTTPTTTTTTTTPPTTQEITSSTSVSTPSTASLLTTSPQTETTTTTAKATTTRETATTTTAATGEAIEPSDEPDLGLILGITIPLVIILVIVAFLLYKFGYKCKQTYRKYIVRHPEYESRTVNEGSENSGRHFRETLQMYDKEGL